MRFGGSSSFLGVAISDRTIACAEVSVHGDRRTLRRAATFTLPAGMSLDAPDAVGTALAGFLKQNRFAASRAIVGVPARVLIAVEREVPPAHEQQARAMLRLQAERLAVAESGEVIFDYVGETDSAKPSKVLLVGMLRQRLERIEKMAASAGMSLMGVTSSALALAAGMKEGRDGALLVLGRGGGEMVWRNGGEARMLRHVSFAMNGHDTPPILPLGAELRRAVALANGGVARDLTLLDGVGLEPAHVEELSQRLGVRVDSRDVLSALAIEKEASVAVQADEAPLSAYAPAISLALAGARGGSMPLDFLHSRLALAPRQRVTRRAGWAIALAATAVLALVVTLLSIHQRGRELDDLRAQLQKLDTKPDAGGLSDIAAARQSVERLRYGRGYFLTRPPMLECLRELTLTFRDDERVWARNVTLREDGSGTLTGRAADQRTVLALLGRMQASQNFHDAKLLDSRESDSRSRDVTYSISFTFTPAE